MEVEALPCYSDGEADGDQELGHFWVHHRQFLLDVRSRIDNTVYKLFGCGFLCLASILLSL